MQLVYGSLLWIPLVVLGIDKQGFLYLYIATTLSLITQVPLAMLSAWAALEAKQAEKNQLDTMKLLVALTNTITKEQHEQGDLLEEQEEQLEEILARLRGET